MGQGDSSTRFRGRRPGGFLAAVATLPALLPGSVLPFISPLIIPPSAAQAAPKREGDILNIFRKSRVYVITNEDPALADLLLQGCQHRERRIVTPEEWDKLPSDLRRFVSAVYLINRQRLPDGVRFPERCTAERDDNYQEVTRVVYSSGPTYEVILSAPDAVWLKQAILDFRRLTEPPRGFRKRNVRSLAVVPSSPEAHAAATPFVRIVMGSTAPDVRRSHFVAAGEYPKVTARCAEMDELILLDRSAPTPEGFRETLTALTAGRTIAPGDTVSWRERKPGGRVRVVISAPTADQLTGVLRQHPDPLALPEAMTVLNSARDLRSVRRVAVVGVKSGPGEEALRRRLASRAATELRLLNTFEVLERSGLSEVLSEIALDQAGITRAKDRARVRQMAAADALLLIEITDTTGRTEYATKFKRVTPWMAAAPACPSRPSRLRFDLNIRNDNVRSVAEPLLAKVVGTKNDEEYQREIRRYQREIVPQWQQQVARYQEERRTRPITWEQYTTAKSTVTVSGSLRLVDLADGLVLWETPFSTTESGETPEGMRSLTTIGEDSRPTAEDLPKPTSEVSPDLINRAADTALSGGLLALRGTALLPAGSLPVVAPTADASSASPGISGRVLDIDGDCALVGLGATDGVRQGDSLLISVTDTVQVRATVTRVRPRTCDARIDPDIGVALQARLSAGQVVTRSSD
ncbi:MAG: CsgG/HfaB family protein [Capsulimonadales bacterium]|nr:CsgG/HfaB family protein [Capsulimonadales bacterium]